MWSEKIWKRVQMDPQKKLPIKCPVLLRWSNSLNNRSSTELCLTLIWVEGGFYSPCWFCLNNSETVKAVTLALCSIQWQFIRDVRTKFGILNSTQSPNIGPNSDRGISDFWISGQSLIKGNCHNSTTSDDVDMKLGRVTKLNKRNKINSKIDDVSLENCEVIVIFPIYGQFRAISKPDPRCRVCKF